MTEEPNLCEVCEIPTPAFAAVGPRPMLLCGEHYDRHLVAMREAKRLLDVGLRCVS